MPVFVQFLSLFLVGGLGYGALELLFRGFTHWSMVFAGGICLILMYLISTRFYIPRWQKWILCGAAVTTVEFVVGGLVNIVLRLGVWDYSAHPFNLMGQICLLFFFIWVALAIPVGELCLLLQRHVFSRTKAAAWTQGGDGQ